MKPLNFIMLCFMVAASKLVFADAIESYPFDDEAKQQQFQALTLELRCPKCQNQNLADSNAEISSDLKLRVYQLVQEGNSDEEIVSYLVERYGDFITYKPPVRLNTAALWYGPILLLVGAFALAFWRVKRQSNRQSYQQPENAEASVVDVSANISGNASTDANNSDDLSALRKRIGLDHD